jgi:hypothetical protein
VVWVCLCSGNFCSMGVLWTGGHGVLWLGVL